MAKGSRLAGVANGLVPRRRAGTPDVITCTSEGDDPRGRGRQGVNRPDDAPAGPAHGCELGATTRETHALAVAGNPCASRMIPLESPVPYVVFAIMWRSLRTLPSQLETAPKFAT